MMSDIDVQHGSSMPAYRKAFLMARQTMFMCVLNIQLIGCSLHRPWFSQSSKTPGIPSRNALAPSSRPDVLLARFSSLFHRSHPTADESTELQPSQRQSIPSHHPPRAIEEVAPIRDKEVRLRSVCSITEAQ